MKILQTKKPLSYIHLNNIQNRLSTFKGYISELFSECLLRRGVDVRLCCSVCLFCRVFFVMVPLNFTCLHCLPHSFLEHLFNLYNYFLVICEMIIQHVPCSKHVYLKGLLLKLVTVIY